MDPQSTGEQSLARDMELSSTFLKMQVVLPRQVLFSPVTYAWLVKQLKLFQENAPSWLIEGSSICPRPPGWGCGNVPAQILNWAPVLSGLVSWQCLVNVCTGFAHRFSAPKAVVANWLEGCR